MKVFVTGATGFVGNMVMRRLGEMGLEAIPAVRKAPSSPAGGEGRGEGKWLVTGPNETTDWTGKLFGFDAVIHLAARVHQMNDTSADPLAEFRRVNRDATLRLAESALAQGVTRFVLLSSVKAAVDATGPEGVDDDVTPNPQTPYGVSKREAELGLLELTRGTSLQSVILRSPLVYGPGAKGNLPQLFRLARSRVPLPFGAIRNCRSLIGVENLADAIVHALTIATDPMPVYFVDDLQVSTPELMQLAAGAMGKRMQFLTVPVPAMRAMAGLLGKAPVIDRLTESLAVSSVRYRTTGWVPALPPERQLELTAQSLYPDYIHSRVHDGDGAMEKATFGAGCFWGVEETFRRMPGVTGTKVGYLGGTLDQPTYRQVCTDTTGHAEVVEVTFDPAKIDYSDLVEAFWKLHDPTQVNRQGPDYGTQYRSAIFYHSPEQKEEAEASKQLLEQSGRLKKPVATEITSASTFWEAEEYHQQYLAKQGRSSCHI